MVRGFMFGVSGARQATRQLVAALQRRVFRF